ncbi:MAG TPA: TolC family protein [bacterium]|nr:TolC family protein [bacterium]HNT65680.1 TolC family protein [bacterium]
MKRNSLYHELSRNLLYRPSLIAFLLIVVFSLPSAGQDNIFAHLSGGDTLWVTVQESILAALENNPSMAIQRLQPEIAETYAREQRAEFDPQLEAVMSRNKGKSQRFLGSRPEPFELTSERLVYSAALNQALPTGTTVSAEATMTSNLSSIYTDQYSGTLGVTVAQALLQGGGIGANLARLRQARLDVERSREELKAIAENLVADVENAYWTLYLANQEILIQKQSLDLANTQLHESQERVAVGKLPELELAAVHAEVSLRREAVIDAQSRYEQARLAFLFLLNPTPTSVWQTVPALLDQPFMPVDSLESIEVHRELGLTYRADLKQARIAMQKGKLEIQRTKNGLLPRLDVFISAGRSSYAQSFREGLPDIQSPFYDISAGVNFGFPVINRQARAARDRAEWSHEQLELSVQNLQRLVEWDVCSAYIEVVRSREQIQATRVTRELQEKKLAAEQEKFRVGKSTNFLVLQAQRDLTAGLLDEAQATVAHLNALIDLYLLEGTLLERRGIGI